jgi:hypothetical protein
MEISPGDKSIACPKAFATALIAMRNSFGAANWPDFVEKLYSETAKRGTPVRIGRGAIEPYAASDPSRVKPPGIGLLLCLQDCGLLYLENGDPVTVQALADIYYCKRLPNGDLIKSTKKRHRR